MADKICTFNYANNNFQAFKKVGETIPATNECMTKTDVTNLLNIEPNSLDAYASNRLIPIPKIKAYFVPTSTYGFYGSVNKAYTDSSNDLICVGSFTLFNQIAVNKWAYIANNGETLYTSSGWGNGPDGSIFAHARNTSYLLFGGTFSNYKGTSSNCLFLTTETLNLYKTYDLQWSGGLCIVYDVIVLPDNTFLVGGNYRTFNGNNIKYLCKLTSTGDIDSSFSTNIIASPVRQILYFNNKIWVCCDNGVYKLNTNGTIDSSFSQGAGFNSWTSCIYIQSDGKIIIGGNFTTYRGVSANNLVRLNSDGTRDTTFNIGTGFDYYIMSINIIGDKIYVGGGFSSFNGFNIKGLIRLNTDGSRDDSFDTGVGFTTGGSTVFVNSVVYTQTLNALFVVGAFSGFNGLATANIVLINLDGTLKKRYLDYPT